MALHFVSTSVLSSSDGIEFNNETQKESEEQRKVRLKREEAASKPLYLQLQEREAEKQAEYDAMTKKLFAPPRAMDEEDEQFYSKLRDTQERNRRKQQEEERALLAAFRSNQDAEKKALHPGVNFNKTQTKNKDLREPQGNYSQLDSILHADWSAVIIRAKRKRVLGDNERPADEVAEDVSASLETEEAVKKTTPPGDFSSLLGGYGSDAD